MNLPESVAELAALLQEHESLNKLFECHQRALLAKDVNNAVLILSKFQADMLRHICFEETCVLPKFVQAGGETAGGTLAIFQAEHQKLKEMIESLRRATLHLFNASDLDAQVIAIFDQETFFKGLFNHHADREQNILIPRLQARTTIGERTELLKKHVALAVQTETASPSAQRFVDVFAG